MEIAYRHEGEVRTIELSDRGQVSDLLAAIEVPPDAVLVTLTNDQGTLEPIPLTYVLSEGDMVELVTIASGG